MRCLEEGRMLIVSNLIERPDERLDAVILRHYLVEDGETKVRHFPSSRGILLQSCRSALGWALLFASLFFFARSLCVRRTIREPISCSKLGECTRTTHWSGVHRAP